ncbi:iron-siderophore ABC transporter substrate-binding protein [Clavibacter phaseoli]|uniref:iron-siderophore ABC transporter substrate-binding protein n=1 Tax=Clavibacter phaseoli TaxID=1734031 RepID=UPI000E65F68F|nr:iron-siderophore ABC transporter substrate-binding protein [Clavibacter phaseoli]RIJ55034.1 iron-siderophore ABC transporter substrate-binding protein [Clavibacter phaseoli]UKF31955.1 iron-siderophore ABC transporter substrate-binding protein [Clavibacter phaseoli]UKF37877.1 iron-siderophore ABC transporter substrate-binding protein [Clavibacter phaseoli]
MITRRRTLAMTALAAATALTLTACGTTEEASTGAGSTPSGEQVTLTDGTGAEVTLDGPATKVVGTEWNVVENLVSLGVDPVGVADVAGYGAWSAAVPLVNEPADIGTRGEPSVETIASLAPDLIVATTDLPVDAIEQLKAIAPVLQVESADGSKQIQQSEDNLELIAKATGTEDQATKVIDAYDQAVTDAKAKLDAAGLAGSKFLFADAYVDAGAVTIRPFGTGSLIGDVTTELGLENAWTGEVDPAYGLGSTDVEGLTTVGDVQFLYNSNATQGDDPFASTLAGNAVWQSLPFVTAGDVHRMPDGIWAFGGPASMTAYATAVSDLLAG